MQLCIFLHGSMAQWAMCRMFCKFPRASNGMQQCSMLFVFDMRTAASNTHAPLCNRPNNENINSNTYSNDTHSFRKCCIANCSKEYFVDGLVFNDDICSSVSFGSSLLPLPFPLLLWWWLLLLLPLLPLLYCKLFCCENECCCGYWWLGEADLPFCSMWWIIASSWCCCNNDFSTCCCCCCWWWCWWWDGDDGDDAFVCADEWICASSRSIGTFSVCAAARAPDDRVDAFDWACGKGINNIWLIRISLKIWWGNDK